MDIQFTVRNLKKGQLKSVRKTVKKTLNDHLDSLLENYHLNQNKIHVTIEYFKDKYRLTLRLHIPPRKILLAKETDEKLTKALNQAVKELDRQVKKHQAKISGRENWKRKSRRNRIKQLKMKLSNFSKESHKESEQKLQPLLFRLEQYIRRELSYLRANGDLPASYPIMEDIRDEVILRLQLKWDELEDRDEKLYQTLVKTVHEVLAEETRETSLHEKDISLEAELPEDPVSQAESMVEEETGEFYQPFEALHIEDIIPDNNVSLPDELVEKNAKDSCYQIMATLPNQWRQVISLVYQEQFPVEQVSESLAIDSISRTQRLLEHAEAFLLESLKDRGIALDKELLLKLLRV